MKLTNLWKSRISSLLMRLKKNSLPESFDFYEKAVSKDPYVNFCWYATAKVSNIFGVLSQANWIKLFHILYFYVLFPCRLRWLNYGSFLKKLTRRERG